MPANSELLQAVCCPRMRLRYTTGWLGGGTGLRHTVTTYCSEVIKQAIKHEEASPTPPAQNTDVQQPASEENDNFQISNVFERKYRYCFTY